MVGFFKSLKNAIQEEVRQTLDQPQQQQQQQRYQQQRYQQQQQQYHPPPPQGYVHQQQYQPQISPSPPAYGYQPHPPPPPSPRYEHQPQPQPQPPPPPPRQPQAPAPAQVPAQPNPRGLVCPGREPSYTRYVKFYVPKTPINPSAQGQDHTFSICEACFVKEVSLHPDFPSQFELMKSNETIPEAPDLDIPSAKAICDFWIPIVRNTFYDQCLSQSNLAPLFAIVRQLQPLPPCVGSQVVSGGEPYVSSAIPHCTICAECVEAYFISPSVKNQFKRSLYRTDQQWFCDIGKDPGYVQRSLVDILARDPTDFNSVASVINQRFAAPPCPGEGNPIQPGPDGTERLYKATDGPGNICEECFLDRFKGTNFERMWTPAPVPRDLRGKCPCDLTSGLSKFLMALTMKSSDAGLARWRDGMLALQKIPKCQGILGVGEETVQEEDRKFGAEARWYHVNGYPILEACPSCYLCIIRPLGAQYLFTPVTRELRAGMVRVCNFWIGNGGISSINPADYPSTLHWRGFMLRHLLSTGFDSSREDYGPFMSFSKVLSEGAPACGGTVRGFKKIQGRRWFGHVQTTPGDNDCTIVMCQECYEQVSETSIGPYFRDVTDEVYQGDQGNQKMAFCQPFSKTSKSVIQQAAQASDFTILARHWNNRERIRAQTLPLIEAYKSQALSQAALKANTARNALARLGASHAAELAGGDTGWRYGNSQIGYGFQSQGSADAEIMFQKSQAMPGANAGLFSQIDALERQWKAVE